MKVYDVVRVARKWLRVIIIACLVGGAAGLVVSLLQPKQYTAEAIVYLVSPNHSDGNTVTGDQQAAKAFTLIPQSGTVLAATLQALGDPSLSIPQLSSMITVDNSSDSQFVYISVSDNDANRAIKLDEEVTKQSVAQFAAAGNDYDQAKPFLKQEMDRLETEIKTLEMELANLQQPSTSNAPNPSADQLNQKLANDRALYNQLLNSYVSMDSTQAFILQDAQISSTPSWSRWALATAIGMLAGLVAIAGAIIFVERGDDILRTPAKVRQATNLSTFITVEHLPTLTKQAPFMDDYHELTEEIATSSLVPPQHVAAAPTKVELKAGTGSNRFHSLEEFVTLGVLLGNENSQLISNEGKLRSLLITSPDDGDGKTLIASQIALGLARTGAEVILIDANLRSPQVHDMFGLSNGVGLSSLLSEQSPGDESGQAIYSPFAALQKTCEPHLTVLSSGPAVNLPTEVRTEVLASTRMMAIINQLRNKAFVVVDSPAVLNSSAPVILAGKCDAILLVADARRTSAVKLNQAYELLKQINTNVLGVALNHASNNTNQAWANEGKA